MQSVPPPYLLGRNTFFEPLSTYRHTSEHHDVVSRLVPSTWIVGVRNGVWLDATPPATTLPSHGWKIHISGMPKDTEAILEAVVPALVSHAVPFKCAVDRGIYKLMCSKRWPRGSAGKFVTIYPKGEEQCRMLLAELSVATATFRGPYILSDRRFAETGIVFYRFGSFRSQDAVQPSGEYLPLLKTAAGTHADLRQAYFALPPGIDDPFVAEAAESDTCDDDGTLGNGRYRVTSALAHNVNGGIYLATDATTGDTVVIKEGRPFVTMMGEDVDAAHLRHREYRILRELDGLPWFPRAIDVFADWEHTFLVQQYIDGALTLSRDAATRHPILFATSTLADRRAFAEHFRTIFVHVARALEAMHSRGFAFGDLSPNNILVRQTDAPSIFLIDVESVYRPGDGSSVGLFTPGFADDDYRADGGTPSAPADLFALGACMMCYVSNANFLLDLSRPAAYRLLRFCAAQAGLPTRWVDLIVALTSADAADRPPLHEVQRILGGEISTRRSAGARRRAAAIPDGETLERSTALALDWLEAQRTPARDDRLFPCDPRGFVTNAISVGNGAAGVLAVLAEAGRNTEDSVAWIARRLVHGRRLPHGLNAGYSGIAWALRRAGQHDEAERLLNMCLAHELRFAAADLFNGEAGLGLCLLDAVAARPAGVHLEKAVEIAEWLDRTGVRSNAGVSWPDGDGRVFYGLGHGATGVALFLLYLHRATGTSRWLDLGRAALEFDLAHGSPTRDGGLSWLERPGGLRLMPYWEYGTAGIAAVTARYVHVTGECVLKERLALMFTDIDREYSVYPGMYLGLAGIGHALLDVARFAGDERAAARALTCASGILRYGIRVEQGLAFPGTSLLRLSCDYATGSAGVIGFLRRCLHGRSATWLPDDVQFPLVDLQIA